MDRNLDAPVLTISAAAELAGMHPQTLRQYDRLGLVVPRRAAGRGRRYTLRDVAALHAVQQLSGDGVNLEGIRRILELEREVRDLRASLESLRATADPGSRVFAATIDGDVVSLPRGRRPAREAPDHAGATPLGSRGPSPRTGGQHTTAVVIWRAH